MTITEFILARVAEKEAFAKGVLMAIEASPGSFVSLGLDHPELAAGDCPGYIRDYEPERDLAECEAIRKAIDAAWRDHVSIEGEWGMGQSREAMDAKDDVPGVVTALAAIWVDHPDYREEWR